MSEFAPNFAKVAVKVAQDNPDVADYKRLSEQMLDEITGHERDLLAKLLPGYMRSVLSRRARGGDIETWDEFLAERLATPDRGTIFVADATAPEIDAAVERRRAFAGNLDRRARRFQKVVQAMREQSSATVRELPPEMGAAAIQDIEAQIAIQKLRRHNAESQAKTLTAVERCIATVTGWISAQETPRVAALRAYRDKIADQIAVELKELRLQQMLYEVLGEMNG